MIFGMGMLELGVTFSLVQLVIDDMIAEEIKTMIDSNLGIEMLSDPDRLTYLTRKGFPYRYWSPHRVRGRVFPRERPVLSDMSGLTQEASQRVHSILSTHRPTPLSPLIVSRIREIIADAEERRENQFGNYSK